MENDTFAVLMKKIVFIVNPIAGTKGKQRIIERIRELSAADASVEVLETAYAGHAEELAAQTDADIVVAVGGDGTVNEVARALVGTTKALAIVPCGSGDGLALHLGLSRDLEQTLHTVFHGHTVVMDYALCDGKPFFCSCGMGLDAIVSHRFANAAQRGLSTYVAEAFKAWRHFVPERYILTIDGEVRWQGAAAMISVCNANQWGNNARIAAGASVADGLLDIVVVKPFHLYQAPQLVYTLFAGKVRQCAQAECLTGKVVEVAREQSGPIHRDGDSFVAPSSFEVSIRPQQLRVVVDQAEV